VSNNNNISPKDEIGDRNLNSAYSEPEVLPITDQSSVGNS